LLGHEHRASCEDAECREERLKEADRRLHEQATRLHVLEWEAYGPRRKQPQDHH
jgi:hypothetical protein